jgi:hypothetical protein
MLIRRAVKGDLPLIPAAKKLQDEIMTPGTSPGGLGSGEPLEDEMKAVAAFKKVVLMVLGTAMQTFGQTLTDEQEVLSFTADLIIDTYAAESAVLRADAAIRGGHPNRQSHEDAARVFVHEAALRVEMAARNALAALSDGDALRTLLAALRRVLKTTPVNAVAMRRRLADATATKGRYIFQ